MKAFKMAKSSKEGPKAKTLKEIEAEFETKGSTHDVEDGASDTGTLTSAAGSSMAASTTDLAPGDGLKEAPWATMQAEKKKQKR